MAGAMVAKVRGLARRGELGLEACLQHAGWTSSMLDQVGARRLTAQWHRERVTSTRAEPSLVDYESSSYSQNGEDGLLAELFRRIGTTNRFFVEIGASDGAENCTRLLAETGWQGLWIESDQEMAKTARAVAGTRVEVAAVAARRDNIVGLLSDAGVPARPDLLVIDIDGNDWWVLDPLLRSFRPRVLVAEYNGAFQPGQWWRQRYQPSHAWDRTFRYGASLTALDDLAASRALTLVACDSNGVNAFFVERESLAAVAITGAGDLRHHYVGPWFSSYLWGHPRLSPGHSPMHPIDLVELDAISVTELQRLSTTHPVAPCEPVPWRVRIENRSAVTLRSTDPNPVHVAAEWQTPDGLPVESDEPRRIMLPVGVPPDRHRAVAGWLAAPHRSGSYQLVVTLVQEHVAWLVPTRAGGNARLRVDVHG